MTGTKIGEKEATAYLATIIISKVFLTYPTVLIGYAGNAAWAAVLLSGLVTVFFLYFIVKLIKTFPEMTYPEICQTVLGTYLGLLFAFLPVLGWLAEVSLLLRNFSESMLVVALPETPLSIVIIFFLVACAIAVYLGIMGIARAAYLAFPFTLLAILAITLLSFSNWKPEFLFPILGKGILPVLKTGIIRSSDFLEITVLYGLPFLFYPKQIARIGIRSTLLSTAVFLLVVITFSMAFPFPVSEEPYLPLYIMARGVFLGDFFQRIEAIFVLFWVFAGLLLLSAGFYSACMILTQALRLPDYKPLVAPLGIIIFALSFIPASLPDAVFLANYGLREGAFMIFYGIPIFLLIIARFRGGGSSAKAKKEHS